MTVLVEKVQVTGTLRTQGRAYYLLSPPPSYKESAGGMLEFLVTSTDAGNMIKRDGENVPCYQYPRQLVVKGSFSVELHNVRKILVEKI